MGEYRLTLVSNSAVSSELYPSNTVAKFTTRLHTPVEVEGDYEIAMTKIQFPISFYNISDDEYFVDEFAMDDDGVTSDYETCTLANGNYSDIRQLVRYLNTFQIITRNLGLGYNEDSARVQVLWTRRPGQKMVNFSPKLRAMLGFPPEGESFIWDGTAPNPVNLYRNVHQQLFVYCDVVEPQLVGDSSERVLRTVGIEDVSKFGNLFVQRYANPDYVPLQKKQFHTIEIDIRTYENRPAPFEYGPSMVNVHIRRARSSRKRR
jgi:hypothetical protein